MTRPFLQDLRHAIRNLRKSPGFALTAIVTLALGVGAVTAVFSVVRAVLLNPFAFHNPGQLIVVRETLQEMQNQYPALPVNYLHYTRLKADSRTLEDAAIFQDHNESLSTDGGHPQIVTGLSVSSSFLSVLGVQPVFGRNFTSDETAPGRNGDVVLLSYETWQKFFQGDAAAVGKSIRLNGESKTIIGVLPQSFRFPNISLGSNMPASLSGSEGGYAFLEPLIPGQNTLKNDVFNYNYKMIARLKPGVAIAQVQAELQGLQQAHTLSAHLPVHLGIAVQPFAKDITGGVSTALWLLFAAVGAVLLIACVNLANLQLARAVSREHEIAVRTALGANKRRLFQSSLAESLVLAIAGGGVGIFLAEAGVKLLLQIAPGNLPRMQEVHVNWIVLVFAASVAILTALLFGTLPALRSLRVQPQQAMQSNTSRAANTRQGATTRNVLVATEVACTVVLLIVTALVIRSFARVLDQGRGFNASHVTVAQVDLYAPQYGDTQKDSDAAKISFIERSLQRMRQLPGVQSAAITSELPMTGDTWVDGIQRADHPVPPGQEPKVNVRWVSPDYFSLMQVPLMTGRYLTKDDKAHPDRVVISESAAREAWPGENPVGREMQSFGDGSGKLTVVGVVADARINNLKQVVNTVYLPFWTSPPWHVVFLIRSSSPTQALAPAIHREIWNIDPQVAIPILKSMDEQISDSVALERFQTMLLSSFGIAALSLALLGIYGVLSYSVSRRAQEMGIRIALGAGKAELVKLIVRQAMLPVACGLGAGLVLAAFITRTMQSMLYETNPADPLAIGISVAVLLLAAVSAAMLPAYRATNTDPIKVLRAE
ncbi:ABC transporter permease [Acidobacterium sp. S8]|uniref:ABC transporter permease n=1 Tax=Acidobacterium sp. S8 TaxID=1641854 RepID=UPI00131D5448|nr:ABC transporter permease [Acidobacterium sp. S8]